MLKTKPLNALLSQSLSDHVSSALLFTPAGSLLATATSPTSADSKKARVYAALGANIWANYERIASQGIVNEALQSPSQAYPSSTADPAGKDKQPQSEQSSEIATAESSAAAAAEGTPSEGAEPLQSVTIELSEYNMHMQIINPKILLCLIGPKQPTAQPSSSSSQKSYDGSPEAVEAGPSSSLAKSAKTPLSFLSTATSRGGASNAGGTLGVLKLTAETLVEYLKKELKDFDPPDII